MAHSLLRAVLLGLMFILPSANGAADPLLWAGFAVLTSLLAATSLALEWPRRVPVVAVLAAGGLLLAGLQLIPIPGVSSSLRSELTEGIFPDQKENDSTGLLTAAAPHSLYPAGTRFDAANLALALGGLWAGMQLLSRQTHFRVLCTTLSLTGAAVSLFGIGHQISGSRMLYWYWELKQSTVFGPFVYHNLAGNFLMMTLGASAWVLACELRGDWNGEESVRSNMLHFVARLNVRRMLFLTSLVLNLAGLQLSLSRGAILSAIAGGAVVVLVGFRRSSWRTLALALPLCLVSVLIVYAYGFETSVAERYATLADDDLYEQEPRIAHWADLDDGLRRFGLLGSGLGTYRYVYRMTRDQRDYIQFDHAHNQYIEALFDGGIPALLLLLTTIAFAALAMFRLIQSGASDSRSYLSMRGKLGLYVVVAQACHAVFDYVLYLPGSYFPFAVLLGACLGSSDRVAHWSVSLPLSGPLRYGRFAAIALVLWAGYETAVAMQIRHAINEVPWDESHATTRCEDLDHYLSSLETWVPYRADDANLHDALASLYKLRYRVQLRDAIAREMSLSSDDPKVWEWTAPIVLHNRAHVAKRTNNDEVLTDIRSQQIVRENLQPAREHALQGLQSCPILSSFYLHLALTDFLDDSASSTVALTKRIAVLEPGNPDRLHEAGRLCFSSEAYDEANEFFRQSLALSEQHIASIFVMAGSRMSLENFAEQLLQASASLHLRLAKDVFADEQLADKKMYLLERAAKTIESLDRRSITADDHFLLARIYANMVPPAWEKAKTEYQEGLKRSPWNLRERFAYAQMLLASGSFEEAQSQTMICIRSKPRHAPFRRFSERIRRESDRALKAEREMQRVDS